jgi:hypothetical protein
VRHRDRIVLTVAPAALLRHGYLVDYGASA